MDGYHLILILLFLVIAAAVIIGAAIYNRKRRQPTRPEVLDETQLAVIAEKYVAPQKPQLPVVEEAGPMVPEEMPLTPVAETGPTGIHEAYLPEMAETQSTVVEEAQSRKAQEPQPTAEGASLATAQETKEAVPAETQPPTIEEEVQTSQAGETQAVTIEEAQAMVAEETEPTGTERVQQEETVKVQPEGAEEAGPEVKSRPRPPIKRGGRPRGPTQNLERKRMQGTRPRCPNPEIVCWKRERQWVLAVEVPEELLEKPGLTVHQSVSPLLRDELEEACWRLEQVSGDVIVHWNEDEVVHETKVDLGQENYLLFRLSGQNLNQGRRLKYPSSGWYLVIAPKDWKRDEAVSGPPPTAPEPVCLEGYQAHFFCLEQGGEQKIVFQLPDGRPLVIEAKAPRFELVGNRIEDASERMAPLFGEGPPRIRALDRRPWEDVKTIVVGEEGSGRGRWRTAFQPDPEKSEQDLPSELAARKSGWYFLRFYNADGDLVERMDFRFVSVLKELKVLQPSSLPSEDGHKPVRVELAHEADCAVQPVSNVTNIQVERQDDKTVLIVPPDLDCDESTWLVGPERGPWVEVTINVEKIWWAVGEEHTAPSDWQDRPVILAREDFKATSSKALWLRLPKPRWVDKVVVGFERSKARPYNVKRGEKTVAIPLRDYGDCPEVEDETQEYNLKIWVKDTEGILALLPISQVRVAPVPLEAMPSLRIESWSGIGRKKTAIAEAVMRKGSGKIYVNGQLVDGYFGQAPRQAKQFLERLRNLEKIRKVLSRMEVDVTVQGSSPTTMRQAKAVAHAIARTLMSYDHDLTPVLKQAGFGGTKVRASKAKGGKP